jgi:hypothetical protein
MVIPCRVDAIETSSIPSIPSDYSTSAATLSAFKVNITGWGPLFDIQRLALLALPAPKLIQTLQSALLAIKITPRSN